MLPITPNQEDLCAPLSGVRLRGGNHREVLAAWFADAPMAAANELTGTGESGVPAFVDECATGRIPFLIF
jgi:hypothetical protein